MPILTDEPLLKVGQYVYLKGVDYPKDFRDRIFRVVVTQQINYMRTLYLNVDESYDFPLDDNGLYPTSTKTLYEVRTGMKGEAILYPMFPTTTYYNALEDSGYQPDPNDPVRRYIGMYTSEDIPTSVFPPRLAEYPVKEFSSIVYKIVNDSIEPEKIILKFLVNRCEVVPVSDDEKERILSHIDDYISLGMLRVINSPSMAKWGGLGGGE